MATTHGMLFPAVLVAVVCSAATALAADDDWPSYNKTLTSERFSSLDEITPQNVRDLETICMYDTRQQAAFHTGPLVVEDTLESGERLWSQNLDAAIAGGVISYQADGRQRIAFAAGMISPIWPTQEATGRIVVFGLC